MSRAIPASAVALLVAVIAAGPVEAASFKRCGDVLDNGAFVGKIRAAGVSCTAARRVVRRWMRADHTQDPVRIRRWRCRYTSLGHESGRIRCIKRGERSKIVRFRTAA